MKYIKTFSFLAFVFLRLTSFGQKMPLIGKEYAQQELRTALKDKRQDNFVDSKRIIIKDSLTAISVAEPILFGIYGKDQITNQRPYEIYFIDNYWIINGRLSGKCSGGVFLIIIDSRDSKIVKIIHGK